MNLNPIHVQILKSTSSTRFQRLKILRWEIYHVGRRKKWCEDVQVSSFRQCNSDASREGDCVLVIGGDMGTWHIYYNLQLTIHLQQDRRWSLRLALVWMGTFWLFLAFCLWSFDDLTMNLWSHVMINLSLKTKKQCSPCLWE